MLQRKSASVPKTYTRPYDAARIEKIRAAFAQKTFEALSKRAKKSARTLGKQGRKRKALDGWKGLTPEEKKARLETTIRSPEAIKKNSEVTSKRLRELSAVEKRRKSKKGWAGEKKDQRLEKMFITVKALNYRISRAKKSAEQLRKILALQKTRLARLQERSRQLFVAGKEKEWQSFLPRVNATAIAVSRTETKLDDAETRIRILTKQLIETNKTASMTLKTNL